MKTQYEPLLPEHPCVGATLSQAELYRTHFTTTLYEPAKVCCCLMTLTQNLHSKQIAQMCETHALTPSLPPISVLMNIFFPEIH